jgi:transposase
MSQREATGKFNIRYSGILAEWKRGYDFRGIDALAPRKRGRTKTIPDEPCKLVPAIPIFPLARDVVKKRRSH